MTNNKLLFRYQSALETRFNQVMQQTDCKTKQSKFGIMLGTNQSGEYQTVKYRKTSVRFVAPGLKAEWMRDAVNALQPQPQ